MIAVATLVLDPDRLLDDTQAGFTVDRIADYPQACLMLREALRTGKPLTLRVRNGPAATWLAAIASACGEERVKVRVFTAREALAARWQITVPRGITDAEILQAGLLDERVTAREGQAFADLVLAHFYDDALVFRTLPVSQLDTLLNNYEEERWKAASQRPLVARVLRERLAEWHQRAQNEAARSLVEALRQDPTSLRRHLRFYKVLRNYPPTLGQKVLRDQWDVFRKAMVEIGSLSLDVADNQAVTEIEYYLESQRENIHSPEDVAILLEQMSGYLEQEFRFINALLRAHPEWVSSDLLRRIDARFRPIESIIGNARSHLRKLVKPPFPVAPGQEWTATEWLAWAHDQYMPYYAWVEVQNCQDETLAGYADEFAEWYFENFVALKNGQPERFAFSGLYREREKMAAPAAVTLALIIDNFNYVHFEDLCRLFRAQGMALATSEPAFSLIPTATEIGKAALIAATGDLVDLPANSYAGLVDKQWNKAGSGKSAAYLANIGELQRLSALNHDIYFLNYLRIDEALHQDVQETGRPHAETIYEHLGIVANSVTEFAKRFQLEKRLNVYVLSDHGGTRIGQGVVNVLDASFYKGLADKNHHRYLALTDDKFASLPQAAGQQCYLIDRHKFKTDRHYLAARRYYRFLPTTEDFFVHGGLTPEEVVVPFSRFTFLPVAPKSPTLTLLDGLYRYAVKSRIRIEVGNPNAFPIVAVSLRLMGVEAEEVVLDTLGPKKTEVAELVTVFRKTVGGSNTRALVLRLRYSYQGTEYAPPDAEFSVTVRAVMEESDGLDDLF